MRSNYQQKKSPAQLEADRKENIRLAEIAKEIPGLLDYSDNIEPPTIQVSEDDNDVISITFPNQEMKSRLFVHTGYRTFFNKFDNPIRIGKNKWEDILVFLLLRKKLSELGSQKNIDHSSIFDSTKNGVVGINLHPESAELFINALDEKYGEQNEPCFSHHTSSDKSTLTMYKRGLKNFLESSDQPALLAPINQKIANYTDQIKNGFSLQSYKIQLSHCIEVLAATKTCLQNYLDCSNQRYNNNDSHNVLKDLHDDESFYPRWAENTETKKIVENAKRILGFSSAIIALDTRIAERINTYKQNISAENDALLYTNHSKIDLWNQKINVLLNARASLYQDGYNGDLIEIEHNNSRWIEGDYSNETRRLISDIKKEKGVSQEIIALDNKISDAINTYHRYIKNESWLSINKDKNIKLWQEKIAILTEAKNVIYFKSGSPESYSNLLVKHKDAWQTGSTTRVIVAQVKDFHEKNKEASSKFNPAYKSGSTNNEV